VNFVTGIRHGDARSPGALSRILQSVHWPTSVATAGQRHGSRVCRVAQLARPREYREADGLLTDVVEQPLAIFSADCVPVFLQDRQGRVVGLLHAGWRGVAMKILGQAVADISRHWGIAPPEVSVWIGPHIHPCCFEVRWDVARHFPRTRKRRELRWTVNLAGELQAQARRLGVRWVRKKPFEGCTMHGSRYFSYRRDKTSKRQVSIIMKRDHR
jgi:hypothetical protein